MKLNEWWTFCRLPLVLSRRSSPLPGHNDTVTTDLFELNTTEQRLNFSKRKTNDDDGWWEF